MSSTTGVVFRVTTWGESHGPATGAVVDGCPAGLALSEADIQPDLDRRRPGRSVRMSQRQEADRVVIESGVFDGVTMGTPIALRMANVDADPSAYDHLKDVFRPSHADFTYHAKHGGLRDHRGGGRASARETAARVAAAAVARKLLGDRWGVVVRGWVERIGDETDPARFDAAIDAARRDRDTVGGVIGCAATGVPPGWGEPVFDKLEADLAKACLSIPAAKGFESGAGFAGAAMRGSVHNDAFEPDGRGGVRTRTNHSGGIQGGISNGMPVLVRVAFKPVATLSREQDTVDLLGNPVRLKARGRHDPCVVPRAVPIVEAAVLLTLADHALRHRALCRPGQPDGLGGAPGHS